MTDDHAAPTAGRSATSDIRIDRVTRAFGEYPALSDVSVTIPAGQLVALLGPSGSGKTTLLRIIAGIDAADRGSIRFGDVDVTARPIQDRRVGFVFQDYALFDHMTVADNIAFGLSVRRRPPAEIAARVRDLIARVQLHGLAGRYPKQLSGGQRQRVALARALAPEPRLLLLDEPFGALDARVRAELRGWLRRLHDELHLTSVFVTHDQEEALEVADQIVVMNAGRIEQVGEPGAVFDRPASAFVMDFLGGVNVLHGQVTGGRAVFGALELPYTGTGDGPARAYIRGHDLVLRPATEEPPARSARPELEGGPEEPAARSARPELEGGPEEPPARSARIDLEGAREPHLPVVVERIRHVGVAARVHVSSAHGELTAEVPHHELAALGVARGAQLIARVRSARIFLHSEPEEPT